MKTFIFLKQKLVFLFKKRVSLDFFKCKSYEQSSYRYFIKQPLFVVFVDFLFKKVL